MRSGLPLLLTLLFCFPLAVPGMARQTRPVPYPVLPTPQFEHAVAEGTRSTDGTPGSRYWINGGDYTIHAVLSPATRMLRGQETIRYHNNSPNDLEWIVVHLRQNLQQEGVIRNRPQKLTGGMHLSEVRYNGEALLEQASLRPGSTGYFIDGTLMYLVLPVPLASGETGTLDFSWSFEVPGLGAPRMGQDGEVFYLGYWYPQVAVYDDVNGWKADPYMGNGEFYMDYGTYDVTIDVPEGWLVGATGMLRNPDEVLSEQTRTRLAMAAENREIGATVHVVEAEDRVAGRSTSASDTGRLTWRFHAENVRDFAFGTSAQYVWDATTAEVGDRDGDGTSDFAMIHALYRPEASSWERSAEFGKFSIEYLSKMFMPYPYPHMTTVEGIIGGGMEYPMITLIGGARNDRSLFGVTFHEIGHMWFPMVVGQDEKQYTWMDEGLTSFNTNEGVAAFWHMNAWDPARQAYYRIAGTGREVEPMRHADLYPPNSPARGIASYSKPAVALNALRGLIGQEDFLRAYREYAHRWAYKHPQPYDLFNTFEDVLGEDLDWFWTTMFYTTWTLDQAVGAVEPTADGVVVTIRDEGLSPMPSPVRVTYADGSVADQSLPVDVWLGGAREATLRFDAGEVVRVEIDPERFLPDVRRENNVWEQ